MARGLQLRRQSSEAGIEISRRLFKPLHLRAERCRPLDKGGVGGAGVGRPSAQRVRRFPNLEQPPLRQRQALIRGLLLALQPDDRGPRLFLAPFEAVTLASGLLALAGQLLVLLHQSPGFFARVLQLRLEADDGLFLLVMLGLERGDRA